jgi:LysR family glycine cleavage system transcriptional activator
MPTFAALRAFEAVARQSSFTRAAAELGITQSAVSYQIKRLEVELGTLLFRRSRRGILLTEQASRLFPVLQRAFTDIAKTAAEVRSHSGDSHLTVALSTYFAAHWLSRRLGAFCQQNPGTRLRLQHPESSVNFGGDDVRMAIRWHKADWVDPDLETELLFLSELSPVCSPRLRAAKNPVIAPQDLCWHTLLRDEVTFEAWSDWFSAAGIEKFHSMRELTINDPNVYIQAAIDGQGVAMGDTLIADEIALGRLIKPFEVALSGYGYFVTYRRSALKHESVRAFRDWLMAETATERYGTHGTQG